ncbi:glycosyltransferase family 4 protein [Tessaracoccus sp. Z1128]
MVPITPGAPVKVQRRLLYGVTIPTSAVTLLRGQLEWMSAQGWDVHVAMAPGPGFDEVAARTGVTAHALDMKREPSPLDDAVSLRRWIALIRELRPDVVNVGTPKAGLLGTMAAWLCRVPQRIYVVRGLRLEGVTGSKRALLWIMERIAIALSTHTVSVSHSLARELKAQRLLPRRRSAIVIGSGSSNGVDVDGVRAAVDGRREELRHQFGISAATKVIGVVGRVTRDKGFDTLAAALRSDQFRPDGDVALALMGSVEDEGLARELEALPFRVFELGHQAQPWPWYSLMDLLCLPTRREGFPNVILEAAVAGIPTVTTRATGAVDSVVAGHTGLLVDVDDAGALAIALTTLVNDDAERTRQGGQARQWAEQEFPNERIWAGLNKVYRSGN